MIPEIKLVPSAGVYDRQEDDAGVQHHYDIIDSSIKNTASPDPLSTNLKA